MSEQRTRKELKLTVRRGLAHLRRPSQRALHGFRVQLRRLRAIGRWMVREEPLLSVSTRKKIQAWLQKAARLQRASSLLRDQEVIGADASGEVSRRSRNWLSGHANGANRVFKSGQNLFQEAIDELSSSDPNTEIKRQARLLALEAKVRARLGRHLESARPSGAGLHRDRIRVKRIRYAKEFWLGQKDKPLAELQDLLGVIQDSVLTRQAALRGLRKRVSSS